MSSNNEPGTRLAPPQPASPDPRSKRRPGRIFKNPNRSSSSRSARTSRSRSGPYDRPSNSPVPTRSHTPNPKTRMLSMFEALPTEIIEQIFLHSLNLNLPRASPFLNRALSREHMYRSLILLAFWDDGSNSSACATINRIMVGPLKYVPLSSEDRQRLQKEVFRCKWFTMERVRAQVPTLQILTIHREWINAGVVVDEEQQDDLKKFLARETDKPRRFYGVGPLLDRLAHQIEPPDFYDIMDGPEAKSDKNSYELVIEPMVSVRIEVFNMGEVTLPALSLVEFPEHLLRGRRNGFLPEDVEFLEMLRMASANSHAGTQNMTKTTVNRAALNEGIQNAIRTQNYDAMVCLLKIDEHLMRWSLEEDGRSSANYTIPSDHFLAVIRTGRDNPRLNLAFFEALLRASAESVPTKSSEVTEWIVDNVELAKREPNAENLMNAKFACWLSDWQMGLPKLLQRPQAGRSRQQAGDFYSGGMFPGSFNSGNTSSQLFVKGRLSVEGKQGYHFYKEVLHPHRKPYGNWLEESSFRTEDYWVKDPSPTHPA
ncbi:unnamed protein product [Penicillium olsonii]|nr:unnamed protein product [Penicillium olsonii]CAG7929651.1 unnamed protein product [Penicillium olsonii]